MYTNTLIMMNTLNFLTWLAVLTEGCCLQYYFGQIMERRFGAGRFQEAADGRHPRRDFGWKFIHGAAAAAAYVVLYAGKNYVSRFLPLPQETGGSIWYYPAEAAVHLGVAVVVAVCFYRGPVWRMLFAVFTYEAVMAVCGDLVSVFSSGPAAARLQDLLNSGLKWGTITWETYLVSVAGLRLLTYAAVTLLSFLSLRYIARCFRETGPVLRRSELFFLLMPSLIGLLMRLFLHMIMWSVAESSLALYTRQPLFLAVIPAILALILLSILYGVKLFQDMIRLGREKNNRAVLERQIDSMQEHIRETERLWTGIRSLRHDMNNALAVAERLAVRERAGAEERDVESDETESGNGEIGGKRRELQAYLAELGRTVKSMESNFRTGNAVADILLDMKYHDALRCLPDLALDADRLMFPEALLIQSYDLGVILSNALDNAVEACRRLREKDDRARVFIRLSSCRRGKMFLIEVENSFDGRVLREEGREFPVTEKPDRQLHGIGLVNIKRACEKYHGAVEWETEGRRFILSVMLQNQEAKEV